MKEALLEAATSNLRHDEAEIPSLTRIFGAARCAHDDIEPALLQDGQRIDHHLVVLMPVKLIWQVKIFLGQLVLFNDLGWIRHQERWRRLSGEANRAGLVRRLRLVFLEVPKRALAPLHNIP